MPTMIQTISGKVTGLWGKAMIQGPDGKMRRLQIGDLVVKGDVILTSQDGIVQLNPDAVVASRPKDDIDIEPAAGAPGGGLLPGLRVDRITEGTSDPGFQQTVFFDRPVLPDTRIAASAGTLEAFPDALTVDEVALPPVRLTGRDSDGFLTSFTVTQVPSGGVLYKADGMLIAGGTVLTPAEADNLVFAPAPNFNGNPGDIVFFVTDNTTNVSDPATVTIAVVPVNDPPVPGTVPNGPDDTPVSDPDPNHIPQSPNYRATTEETFRSTASCGRPTWIATRSRTRRAAIPRTAPSPSTPTAPGPTCRSRTTTAPTSSSSPSTTAMAARPRPRSSSPSLPFPTSPAVKTVGSPVAFEGQNLDFQVAFSKVSPTRSPPPSRWPMAPPPWASTPACRSCRSTRADLHAGGDQCRRLDHVQMPPCRPRTRWSSGSRRSWTRPSKAPKPSA